MYHLKKNKKYLRKDIPKKIKKELDDGLKILRSIKKPIVFFAGGHNVKQNTKTYKHAEELAYALGKKGYAIVTGGGPGVMEAANKGAIRAGAPSIGFKAALITKEQKAGDYFTHEYGFEYIFVRRFCLLLKSTALLVYPGGYGTINEMSENAVLMQTEIQDDVPMICVDSKFWNPFFKWINNQPRKIGLIPYKKRFFKVEDDQKKIMSLIARWRR